MWMPQSLFYTKHFGFTADVDYVPTFASISRGNLRLLLSGEKTSGRKAMPDGTKPVSGGWNRILLVVSDIVAAAFGGRNAICHKSTDNAFYEAKVKVYIISIIRLNEYG
jgi:hypothetical protein